MPTLAYATHQMVTLWLRGIATTPPQSLWLGCLLQAPNPDGTGVSEPLTSGYGRRQLILGEAVSANGVTSSSNANAIVFATAQHDWQSVTYLGVFSDAGALLFYGQMAAPRAVRQGDTMAFAAGAIQLRLK